MNICLILCHSNPTSLNAAIADAYERGAASAGHAVRRLDLYRLDFDPCLHRSEGGGRQPLEPDLLAAQESIEWAHHVVLVFPMWWYGLPARLKGFVDRAFTPGWAFKYRPNKRFWDRLLKGRSAHAIYTMDTPPILATLVVGDPVWRSLKWGILGFVGFRPVRRTVFGPVKFASSERRARWLARAERLGRLAR